MEKVLRTTRDMYSSTLVEVDEQRQFFKFNLLAADSSGISSIRLIEKCRPSVAKFSSNSSFIYSDVLKAHHPKYTAFSSRILIIAVEEKNIPKLDPRSISLSSTNT
ncbi:hypothetical protein T02_7430 [Trichinella nativa]|uniref:Uncharacterized protein n=1 Tax=Trichinella nativa TaxID=6335 RepID=A0A0V1KV11_9BILA|nr:hypothetical protein T06_13583 [Trichinella sp. T6]KRZ50802.1 hypothetical protein T02_7430 [Trichinella nativa]